MKHLHTLARELVGRGFPENLAIRVGYGDRVVDELRMSASGRELNENTLFDMASVTKVTVTATLALIAIDRGWLSPEDKVSRFFSVPEPRAEMSIFHLMTHTMGIGYKRLSGMTYDRAAEGILAMASDVPIGTEVRYSCPGFILLGKIVERVFGMGLDAAFRQYVARPLGMDESGFLPDRGRDIVNANREPCECGLVNDLNCRDLGGVCGNAGLFSNLSDMTRYARMLLDYGAPLMSRTTFDRAAANHTPHMSESRGLGFLYVDGRYPQTGGLFPDGSIGHCGHTGQSVFVHPESGLYVIILSDATAVNVRRYGKENYSEVTQMRHDLHAAIRADLMN